MSKEVSSEKIVKDIRRRTRKKYSAEEKIRTVLDGLRGEESTENPLTQHGPVLRGEVSRFSALASGVT